MDIEAEKEERKKKESIMAFLSYTFNGEMHQCPIEDGSTVENLIAKELVKHGHYEEGDEYMPMFWVVLDLEITWDVQIMEGLECAIKNPVVSVKYLQEDVYVIGLGSNAFEHFGRTWTVEGKKLKLRQSVQDIIHNKIALDKRA